MRPLLCRFAAAVVVAATAAIANAGDWELPSDVGVTLTASPTTGLVPGQPIDMTLSVTNFGPNDLPTVVISSDRFVDEFNLVEIDWDECVFGLVVEDNADGTFDYLYNWFVAWVGIAPPMLAGTTHICHFQIALTGTAPPIYPLGFGLPDFFHDPNPSNDRATVVLERAGAPVTTPVPTLSPAVLALLGALLSLCGVFWLRRSRSSQQ